jgi:hypothetical protein
VENKLNVETFVFQDRKYCIGRVVITHQTIVYEATKWDMDHITHLSTVYLAMESAMIQYEAIELAMNHILRHSTLHEAI